MVTRYHIERLCRCTGRWVAAGLVGLIGVLAAESAVAQLRSEDFSIAARVELHENKLVTVVWCRYSPHERLDFNLHTYSLTRLGPGGEEVLDEGNIAGDRTPNRAIWNNNRTYITERKRDTKGLDSATSRYRCRIRFRRITKFQGGLPVFSSDISDIRRDIDFDRPEFSSPQAPSNVRISDEFRAHNRVTVSWNAVADRSEQAGHLLVEGYTVRRRVGSTWTDVGSTRGQGSTSIVDDDPHAGPVRYEVRTETNGTRDGVTHGVAKGAWASTNVTIRPKPLSRTLVPRDLRVAPHSGSYRLTWSEPENQKENYVDAYEVWFKTDTTNFARVTSLVTRGRREWNLARDTAHPELSGVQHPVPGALYTFYVLAAREDSSARSAKTEDVVIGTETAPLIYIADPTADQGTGWVRVSWAPGPDNGNGAPRDSVDWTVRWRPTVSRSGQAEGAWNTTVLGNPNSRSVTLAVRDEVVDPDNFITGQNYEVEVWAESAHGPGAPGRLVTPNIAPVPRGGSLSLKTDTEFRQGGDTGITWWLEGPTEVFLGERVWYTLRGGRTDASNTTPLTENDYMTRPVGVREDETNRNLHVGNMNQSRHDCGPSRNQVAIDGGGNYKVCVRTVGYDTQIDRGPRVTHEGPSTTSGGSPAYLAYRPTGSGIPYGHRMEIQTRSEAKYADTTFQVGIGLWCSGISNICRRANWAYLRSGDRKFTVTIRHAPPLPPSGLGVSETQNDSNTDVYRLTWGTSSNVNSDRLSGYHVHQRRGTGGSFEQVTTNPITERKYDVIVPAEATAFAWYVTVVTTDNKISEPTDIVRVGVPTSPPTNVQASSEGEGLVELSWEASTDQSVTGYRVDVTSDDGLNWTVLNANVDGLSLRDTGRVLAQVLHYRVTPLNALGDGPPGNLGRAVVEAIEGVTAPSAPNNVQVQDAGRQRMVIAWEPPDSNGGAVITEYKLQRSTTSEDADFMEVTTARIGSDRRFYEDVDSTLEAGTTYHYKVLAVNFAGDGAVSDSANATTRSEHAPDAPRRLLAATRADGASVTLSWFSPLDTVAINGYRVERVPEGEGIWSPVGEDLDWRTAAFEDVYTDPGNAPTYLYRVSAFNGAGPGEPATIGASAPATSLDYSLADLNRDSAINASDALILYYALSFRELVGDGGSGGIEFMRQQILQNHVGTGTITQDDTGYRQLIRNARQWAAVGTERGGDLNQDFIITEDDALLLYYAHTVGAELGNGDAQSGSVELRETFLGPYIGRLSAGDDAATRDTALRGILMQARAIALP